MSARKLQAVDAKKLRAVTEVDGKHGTALSTGSRWHFVPITLCSFKAGSFAERCCGWHVSILKFSSTLSLLRYALFVLNIPGCGRFAGRLGLREGHLSAPTLLTPPGAKLLMGMPRSEGSYSIMYVLRSIPAWWRLSREVGRILVVWTKC